MQYLLLFLLSCFFLLQLLFCLRYFPFRPSKLQKVFFSVHALFLVTFACFLVLYVLFGVVGGMKF